MEHVIQTLATPLALKNDEAGSSDAQGERMRGGMASENGVHPTQIHRWRNRLLENTEKQADQRKVEIKYVSDKLHTAPPLKGSRWIVNGIKAMDSIPYAVHRKRVPRHARERYASHSPLRKMQFHQGRAASNREFSADPRPGGGHFVPHAPGQVGISAKPAPNSFIESKEAAPLEGRFFGSSCNYCME